MVTTVGGRHFDIERITSSDAGATLYTREETLIFVPFEVTGEGEIDWHDPANLSCKYKRAIAAQGSRSETKPLKSLVDLAAADKPLIEVVQLERDPKPCFGFGTPGTL